MPRQHVPASVAPHLHEVWSEVEARLRRLLRARGVASAADDIVQEVALRVIENDVRFSSAEDLFRWCSVVCRNLSIDLGRRDQRRRHDELVVELDAGIDVGATVESLLLLERVAVELDRLTPDDRDVLTIAPSADRATAVRMAVRRHRVRRRLLARLGEST